MSQPNPTAELHDYMMEHITTYCEPMCSDSLELHQLSMMLEEEIENPKKRTSLYEEYYEFIQESL